MTNALVKILPSALKSVKSSAIILAIAAAIAPSAFAGSGNLVEKKLTVKIAAADLSDTKGVEKTYQKLEDKATAFCKNDTPSLVYLDESVEDCVEDLMEQFIATSGVTSLKTYHEKMAEAPATEKLAMK